ncbi:hypothetical protein GNP75_13875 [Aliivibrio fischeri]|nr:hypothetical protein [Aliivibrio fischeri]MUK34898.1 hypothetical protein [Aliivibrio fischeri]
MKINKSSFDDQTITILNETNKIKTQNSSISLTFCCLCIK